jgi:hypothetical protein
VHRDKPADYSGLLLKNNAFFPSQAEFWRVQLSGQHEKTSTHKDGISQKVAYASLLLLLFR